MREIILVSDDINEIKRFKVNYKNSKVNLLTMDPSNLRKVLPLIESKNFCIINPVDFYNEKVVSQTINEVKIIDLVLESIFNTSCHKWGTLCEGGFLSQSILSINILVYSIERFNKLNQIDSIYIGHNFMLKSKAEKISFERCLRSKMNKIKMKQIKSFMPINLNYPKDSIKEILKLALFFYNFIISIFARNKKLYKSYDYVQIQNSLAYKHTHITHKITSNLLQRSIKPLVITFDINIFKAKQVFNKKINIVSLESLINIKSVTKVIIDYLNFLMQLLNYNSNLKYSLRSRLGDKYPWIISGLNLYSISELLKRLIFSHAFSQLNSDFKVIRPWGPPESAYYSIVKRISKVRNKSIIVHYWSCFTEIPKWPYSDKSCSPDIFFVKTKDEMLKIKEEYNSKVILCEKVKSPQKIIGFSNISNTLRDKEIIKIAFDLKYVHIGHYSRTDQFIDLLALLKGISMVEDRRFEINIKGHPSSGEDNKNLQTVDIFRKRFDNLKLNFIPKHESGEKWVENNDIFITRSSSLQEYALSMGKINISMICTGNSKNYLKPFCYLASNEYDVLNIIDLLLNPNPNQNIFKQADNELNSSELDIEKYCKSVIQLKYLPNTSNH